jgi:hypothetical protein
LQLRNLFFSKQFQNHPALNFILRRFKKMPMVVKFRTRGAAESDGRSRNWLSRIKSSSVDGVSETTTGPANIQGATGERLGYR